MANNASMSSSLDLTQLDFFGLKNSFKNYLRSQAQFKDYDFDGSAFNVLIDELAQNTYKNAFLSNMLHSEGFIDSAQLRNSLFSHSKELNYLPRSIRSAKAKISVEFEASGESQPYIIPKGSQFSTMIKSESYTFTTPETFIVSSANNTFNFTTEIYEGIYINDSYIFLADENQRFKLTNKNVDTRSISVTVFEDGKQAGDIYKVTNTLLDLNEFSKVFFLQTSETGNYEIYFGDDVLHRQPKLNSTIVIDYRISVGTKGNGARVFYVDFEPTTVNELIQTPVLTVIEASKNGVEEETNESIRYYAPRAFQVQERTITNTDYEIALKTEFPEINSVSVYGGELVDPPRFGKVFVAIDITNVDGLPEAKKTEYFNFLKRRAPFSIDPVITEPEYMFLSLSSLVRYNLNVTTASFTRIKTIVTGVILDYNITYLNDFGSTFRLSQLQSQIDNSDMSIVSNLTDVAMYKKFVPSRGILQNIVINFGVPILDTIPSQADTYSATDQKMIYSSMFRYNGSTCVLEDDGDGNIRLVKFTPTERVKLKNVGTIDHKKGIVSLVNFSVDDYDGPIMKLYALPADRDVESTKNVILQVEPEDISIDVEAFTSLMDEYQETVLEKNISSLIATQFPEWYRTEGSTLVEFTKEYYKWLEGSQVVSNTAFIGKGYVTVNAKNANVYGYGTDFKNFFANGDTIALYKQDTIENYDLLTIDTVVNSSFLTLSTTPPDFSSSNSWYTDVYTQYNPNYYLRRYLENKDIDLTTDEFLVYFKEKYLKNIQFDTQTNIKSLLKHSLDIYRSKGTERSVDLLFRAVFGLPASVYYPGDDIYRLSDGKWYQPIYLEISLKRNSNKLVGKQIVGATSGAIGFAETLVRRSAKGRLIDVLYISAVRGNFVIDEAINSMDTILESVERPIIIGSLTKADVSIDGTGANYSVGDIVDIYSNYGEQAKGKVNAVSDITGQIVFKLNNGGYAYRATEPGNPGSQVLISEKVITVSNLLLDVDNNGDNYVYMFDQMVQPLANVEYTAISGGNFANGDMIYSWTDDVLSGTGKVLKSTCFGNTNKSSLTFSNTFSDASWTKTNLNDETFATVVTGPFGVTGSGQKLTENTTNGAHGIKKELSKAASALTYTSHFYAKPSDRSRIHFLATDSNNNGARCTYDLAGVRTGISANGFGTTPFTSISSSITSIANQWVKCTLTYKTNTDTTLNFDLRLDANTGLQTANSSYVGTNGKGVYIWNGQLESGVTATAPIVTMETSFDIIGELFISVLSGDLDKPALYSTANTKSITKGVYANATCVANTIGYYGNTVYGVVNKVGNFILNEEVYQADSYGLEHANGIITSFTTAIGANGEAKISNTYGVFKKNQLIKGRLSHATANVQNTKIFVGITPISNSIYDTPNNFIYFANSSSNGTITNISKGSLANVGFASSLIYPESVNVSDAYIRDFTGVNSVDIDAEAYGFTANPTGNLTSGTLDSMFSTEAYNIGKIQQLAGVNKGTGYNLAPIVRVYDPVTITLYQQDYHHVHNSSGVFKVGEVVTRATAESRGIIKISNSSQIWVENVRLDVAKSFVETTDTGTLLRGSQSGVTTSISSVEIDTRSEYLGFNAVIDSSVQSSVGAITNVSIMSSGFGYKKSESLRFVKSGTSYDNEDAGFGFANLLNQGYGEGYYKRKGGWLSDQSRLFDGIYYQEYSYEVRSSVALKKYEEMLRQILHVAGTKYFGAFVYKTYIPSDSRYGSATITQIADELPE